jgi:hypothetical protein
MLRIGFELTIPVFEDAEIFNVLDHSVTVIGRILIYAEK